jgi:hypothetical protein
MTYFGGFTLSVSGSNSEQGTRWVATVAYGDDVPYNATTYCTLIDTSSVASLDPPYTFYITPGTWEMYNGSGVILYDWWLGTSGIPPMRQRARNDGLTTDTRQERRAVSPSNMILPDLWWIGKPGEEYEGGGST